MKSRAYNVADVSKYPFDTHQCSMMFVLLGYFDTELIVNHPFDRVMTSGYSSHATWDLVKLSVSKERYPNRLYFNLYLKRQPMFFVLSLILPICYMSILNVFVFLLPADSGERVGYAITVLLAIAVFLTISSDNLPATLNPRISIISLLLFTDVVISAIIVILLIIGLRFYHRNDEIEVSILARRFVKFMRCLRSKCIRRNPEINSKLSLKSEDATLHPRSNSNDINITKSKETITWVDVGKESNFLFGILISIIVITVHAMYAVDVTFGNT